jgi:hypothetical protein
MIPGFPVPFTVNGQGSRTTARVMLPGSVFYETAPLPIAGADIAQMNVMYFPGHFLQLRVVHRHEGPRQPIRIPIDQLPAHGNSWHR